MNYFSPKNIYLCDLEFLGFEASEVEQRERGRKVFQVSTFGREPMKLLAAPSPQGWHVVKGLNVDLRDLADYLAVQLEPRERFTYFCFTKIRESKIRAIHLCRVIVSVIAAIYLQKFIAGRGLLNLFPCFLSAVMFVASLFLPKHALKTTYQDYLDEIERDGGMGPDDFYDRFNR